MNPIMDAMFSFEFVQSIDRCEPIPIALRSNIPCRCGWVIFYGLQSAVIMKITQKTNTKYEISHRNNEWQTNTFVHADLIDFNSGMSGAKNNGDSITPPTLSLQFTFTTRVDDYTFCNFCFPFFVLSSDSLWLTEVSERVLVKRMVCESSVYAMKPF